MRYLYKNWYDEKVNGKPMAYSTEALYAQRINGETTLKTGLTIRPMNQTEVFECYYVPTNTLLLKMELVYENDAHLRILTRELPGIAQKSFFVEQIAKELESTNTIEGVASSRHEIAASTKRILSDNHSEGLRMHSLIRTYLSLQLEETNLPTQPKDIREMYDRITQGEIHDKNLPDGELFIKAGADVRNAVDKVIHRGQSTEEKIIAHLEQLLHFVQQPEVPYLVRIAIAHYYFGYIHPFYDGNGRTSRFISSLYLSKRFCLYTAYSLSNGCAKHQAKYLQLFDRTNQLSNYGELNYFIDGFLDLVLSGQKEMIESLNKNNLLLKKAEERIARDAWLVSQPYASQIMQVFCQDALFGDDTLGFERSELKAIMDANATYSDIPTRTFQNTLRTMEEKKYLLRIKSRPITYRLNTDFLEEEGPVDIKTQEEYDQQKQQ